MKIQNGNKITQKIIQNIKCPYQIFPENATLEEVNNAYEKSLARGKKEGFVPLLVISDEYLTEFLDSLENASSKESILHNELDGEEVLNLQKSEYLSDLEKNPEDAEEEFYGNPNDFFKNESSEEKLTCFISFAKFDGETEETILIEETILFEIPVTNPWEVIAWVPFGGWNDCPAAPEMMAICKRWYQQYGAIPAVISHDTMEFIVEQPVQEKQTAWELAKEHYLFCTDRLDQCTKTGKLEELADHIYQSSVWYFWWD